jgi:hypothetical protein
VMSTLRMKLVVLSGAVAALASPGGNCKSW